MTKLIRNTMIMTLGSILTLSTPAFAEGFKNSATTSTTTVTATSKGGFSGPMTSANITDVKNALNASDDTKVTLIGNILSSKGKEDYLFKDATGQISVEIDDDIWQGRSITPETKIIIHGEVDKDWSEISIDADHIEILK